MSTLKAAGVKTSHYCGPYQQWWNEEWYLRRDVTNMIGQKHSRTGDIEQTEANLSDLEQRVSHPLSGDHGINSSLPFSFKSPSSVCRQQTPPHPASWVWWAQISTPSLSPSVSSCSCISLRLSPGVSGSAACSPFKPRLDRFVLKDTKCTKNVKLRKDQQSFLDFF